MGALERRPENGDRGKATQGSNMGFKIMKSSTTADWVESRRDEIFITLGEAKRNPGKWNEDRPAVRDTHFKNEAIFISDGK